VDVVTFAEMQTTHKITGDSATGYAAYVTSASDRGDYYTASAEKETGGGTAMAPSRWHGSPALLADLGLSADGPVERGDLTSLMHGVSPTDGHELRRAGGDGSRVAGIDMTLSAPKSVSALWAVSSPYERARIEAAHSRAVAGTIARVERDVELLRTRENGKLRWERAERLLAAEFVHTSSRLTRDQERGGVPDPQPRRGPRWRARKRPLRRGRLARAVPLRTCERCLVSRGARTRSPRARARHSR